MRINPVDINSNLSQEELDNIVNAMIVSFKEFASISALHGRAYGVVTACDVVSDVLNICARRLVFKHLIAAHEEAERFLLYDLTPRYHTEKVSYRDAVSQQIPLKRPGFAGFYQLTTSDAAMGAQTVDPILINDVPLVDGGEYTIAQLDADLVSNPLKVVLIDATTGHQYNYQDIYGFPRLTGGNWEVPLLNDLLPSRIPSVTVHAFHCELIAVDIPDETLTSGQTLYPVYPGTSQIIPYAKEPEALSPSGQRLWFYAHSLVNSEFGTDGVDLRGGKLEFFKLLTTIDMKIFEETEVLPSLEYRLDPECVDATTETTNETPTYSNVTVESFHITDATHSIIEVFPDHTTAAKNKAGTPVEYTVYYKTDPAILGFERDAVDIKEAVAHKAAAEIPLKLCKCPIDKDGFIQIAQQSYDQIRISITGEKVQNLEHGNLYGQAVFKEKMLEVNTYHKVVRI